MSQCRDKFLMVTRIIQFKNPMHSIMSNSWIFVMKFKEKENDKLLSGLYSTILQLNRFPVIFIKTCKELVLEF